VWSDSVFKLSPRFHAAYLSLFERQTKQYLSLLWTQASTFYHIGQGTIIASKGLFAGLPHYAASIRHMRKYCPFTRQYIGDIQNFKFRIIIIFFKERKNDMLNLSINKLKVSGLAIVLMAFSAIGYADDITDSISEALQYYKNGEYTDALESLDYASQLIKQKKGKGLESFLPEPLSGWTAKEANSQTVGTAMFSGGVTAERKYNKGSSSVTVQIITDSPFMQGVMMMFSNYPMFAESDGGELEKIEHQKAIVKFDATNKRGEIKIVVANRFLVLIEGNGITKGDLKGYAKAIDYKKLASLP
jgi:hypothetical protein